LESSFKEWGKRIKGFTQGRTRKGKRAATKKASGVNKSNGFWKDTSLAEGRAPKPLRNRQLGELLKI